MTDATDTPSDLGPPHTRAKANASEEAWETSQGERFFLG